MWNPHCRCRRYHRRVQYPSAQMLGVSVEQVVGGSLLELCKRAVNEDGLLLGENEISSLIRADAGQQCRRLVMGFRRDDGILNPVSFTSRPVNPHDTADRSGTVILLQKDSH